MFTIDLHSHILPGMDDGAENAEMSLALLKEESRQGIKKIVLSPHYNVFEESVSDFIKRRTESFRILSKAVEENGMSGLFDLRPAAEVRYSAGLSDLQGLEELCISGTNVLLIEFSRMHYPEFVNDVFYRLQTRGMIPLMAHVERFPWLRKKPELLYDLVTGGAYAQFNSDLMLQNREVLSFVRKMLKHGLLHGIGSDTHNIHERPPRIRDAEKMLNTDPGAEITDFLDDNAESLLQGKIPDTGIPQKPGKKLFDFLRL